MGMAPQAHEQRMLIAQSDPARQRVDLDPGVNGLLHRVRNRHLALAAALAAHEQPEVAGVGARAAQILGL